MSEGRYKVLSYGVYSDMQIVGFAGTRTGLQLAACVQEGLRVVAYCTSLKEAELVCAALNGQPVQTVDPDVERIGLGVIAIIEQFKGKP